MLSEDLRYVGGFALGDLQHGHPVTIEIRPAHPRAGLDPGACKRMVDAMRRAAEAELVAMAAEAGQTLCSPLPLGDAP